MGLCSGTMTNNKHPTSSPNKSWCFIYYAGGTFYTYNKYPPHLLPCMQTCPSLTRQLACANPSTLGQIEPLAKHSPLNKPCSHQSWPSMLPANLLSGVCSGSQVKQISCKDWNGDGKSVLFTYNAATGAFTSQVIQANGTEGPVQESEFASEHTPAKFFVCLVRNSVALQALSILCVQDYTNEWIRIDDYCSRVTAGLSAQLHASLATFRSLAPVLCGLDSVPSSICNWARLLISAAAGWWCWWLTGSLREPLCI